MQLTQKEPDYLDIDLVKEHIVVEHDLDDRLILQYIEASALVVSSYIHRDIFKNTYIAITPELTPINGTYMLDLESRPEQLFVTAKGTSQVSEVPKSYWNYSASSRKVLFTPPVPVTLDDITVFVGAFKDQPQITQARLLLIGTYYNYRESVADLRLMEVPHAFKMILDNISAGSL